MKPAQAPPPCTQRLISGGNTTISLTKPAAGALGRYRLQIEFNRFADVAQSLLADLSWDQQLLSAGQWATIQPSSPHSKITLILMLTAYRFGGQSQHVSSQKTRSVLGPHWTVGLASRTWAWPGQPWSFTTGRTRSRMAGMNAGALARDPPANKCGGYHNLINHSP